jgi:opacity protein-like surface antigen
MKRRFVKSVVASVTAACAIAFAGTAQAQEIQLTGPLKGAPAARHLRHYRQGRIELDPTLSFTLLDEYRRTILVGGRLTYNLTDWLGIGVWGSFGAASSTTDLSDQIDKIAPRNELTATNVNHSQGTCPNGDGTTYNCVTGAKPFADQTAKIDYIAAPQVIFTPFRGKLAIFNKIFVDTDLYASGGVAFVGIEERKNCSGTAPGSVPGTTVLACSLPSSFALASTTKVAPTFSVGLTFYPADFWSFGVEYRAVPFSWNRSGFDTHGKGSNGNFPDGNIDSQDETFQFNQLVTISLGFYLPVKPALSD